MHPLVAALSTGMAAAMVLTSTPARAEDIGAVLVRSAQMRLQSRLPADPGERTDRVRASLARLLAEVRHARAHDVAVDLRVMKGGVQAEAMLGHLLVVGESVGDLPEPERLALLAHELGHLALGHWDELNALYKRHIPGEVRPETTDPVADALGREAHGQSHRHELEADAFGYALVRRLGVGLDDELSVLMRQPVPHDTATHPSTRRRLAQLRSLEARYQEQARLAGSDAPARVADAER